MHRYARVLEVVVAVATIATCIGLYLWTILGSWYSVESCSPVTGECVRIHQSALEHDSVTLFFAGVSLLFD